MIAATAERQSRRDRMRRPDDEPTDDRGIRAGRREAAAPRKRRTISDSAQLYIERDDEFTRAPLDEHTPTMPSRRNSFTMQEAENAFLYGMNGGQPTGGYAPRRDAYGRRTAENTPSGSSVPNAPGYPSEPGYPNEPNELSESSEPNAWGEPMI